MAPLVVLQPSPVTVPEPAGVRHGQLGTRPFELGEGSLAFEIETKIYSRAAILRTCYALTDRCFFFVHQPYSDRSILQVAMSRKTEDTDLEAIAGVFCHELIDQALRDHLAEETSGWRELIVAQAFAEGNLLDPELDDADYEDDPRGFGRS